ncbi:unnamed protein product [Auanema sp. JU1783]|nr:unnamed protein product [Auanema sp. JU1783]
MSVEPDSKPIETSEPIEAGSAVINDETVQDAPLSKNQMKKLRARERYKDKRMFKRKEEREKKKRKRQEIRDAGEGHTLIRHRTTLMEDSTCKLRVAVDMAFDHLMSEKDQRCTVQQLGWCYAANRRAPAPLQYYIVNFDGPSRKLYDSTKGTISQDIHVETKALDVAFKPEEIIYLTAESENVLSTLDDSKVYVIGGIVDHNSQKGLCFELAKQKGYGHARLPIDEFVSMKTRKVLTINHVFEILLHFISTNNWEESFFKVIPQRKGLEKKAEGEVEAEAEVEVKAEAEVKEEKVEEKPEVD